MAYKINVLIAAISLFVFCFFPGLSYAQEHGQTKDFSKKQPAGFLAPEIFVQPDSFYLVIKPDTIKQMEMTILNTGDDTLVYSIDANSGLWTNNPEPPDNIEGSELTISPTGYKPGETIDFNMNLYNGSPDNEWIDTLIVYFPEGATVNFATNFIGGTQGPLVFDGSTGNGSPVSWNDADGSNGGNILPGETALSIANIHFDESLNDTLSIVYTIKGDGFGGTPHSITDTIKLTPEEVWLIADPESGTIPPGEEIQTNLFFNSAGIPIGYYDRHFTIHSNDTSNPDFDVPVKLIVFPSSLTHTITIPEGLSAISTYVIPLNSEFETIFDTVNDKIDVVYDIESNLYWPDQGINTIGTWNNGQGYVVNAKEDLQIKVYGLFVISQTVVLNEGWNLMPVLNINPSSTFIVFRDIEELIDIVEEVGGDKVYWPEQNIYTLTQLMPGKAYFIRVKEDCSIVFPPPVE